MFVLLWIVSYRRKPVLTYAISGICRWWRRWIRWISPQVHMVLLV